MLKVFFNLAVILRDQQLTRYDDDFSDKFNHRYLPIILLTYSVIVTTDSVVGTKINCFVPAHFSGPWEEYTNEYCWVKNTYYLPFDKEIPAAHEHDKRHMITYYQWAALILMLQAFLFMVPDIVWSSFNRTTGMDVGGIVTYAQAYHQADKIGERDSMLKKATAYTHKFLTARVRKQRPQFNLNANWVMSRICAPCSAERGTYLRSLYIFIKLLYILNAIGQFFLLDLFLGNDFKSFGSYIWHHMLSTETTLFNSTVFPKVTMCDFNARILGNVQRYTVQCTLPTNLFMERLFATVWMLMSIACILSICSTVMWIGRFISKKDRHRYVRKHTILAWLPQEFRNMEKSERKVAQIDFVDNYLGEDGVFVFRLIGTNTDAYTASEICTELFRLYKVFPPHETSTAVPTPSNTPPDQAQPLLYPSFDLDENGKKALAANLY